MEELNERDKCQKIFESFGAKQNTSLKWINSLTSNVPIM